MKEAMSDAEIKAQEFLTMNERTRRGAPGGLTAVMD